MYHPVRGRLEAGFTQPLGDKFMLQVDLRDSLHEENGDKNIAWRNLPPLCIEQWVPEEDGRQFPLWDERRECRQSA